MGISNCRWQLINHLRLNEWNMCPRRFSNCYRIYMCNTAETNSGNKDSSIILINRYNLKIFPET